MLVSVEKIVGDCDEDTKLLKELAERATNYIQSFRWCLPIKAMYLAYGIGGIVAVFLVEFEGKIGGTDDRLWIFTGELPSVYMIVEPDDNARDALEGYCDLMDDWIAAVEGDGDLSAVYPVSAAPTQEHADMLRSRLAFIRKEIIPNVPTDSIDG
jgi:hypothetical protein